MSKLIIVPEKIEEDFTMSSCDCDWCEDMHNSVKEWEKYTPTTALQRGMKRVVSKIIEDDKNRKKQRK